MKHFPSFKKYAALTIFALTLSGCQTFNGLKQDFSNFSLDKLTMQSTDQVGTQSDNFLIDGDCPQIELVNELSALNEYTDNKAPSQSTLISNVSMNIANSTCEYGDRSVTVDLQLKFDGTLGAKGRSSGADKPFLSYPFFVAVTSSTGKILAKEIFSASMSYEAGQNAQTYFENLRQIIPVDNRDIGSRIKIMIGFQLSSDQLAYNRKIIEADRLNAIAKEEAAAKAIEMEKAARKAQAKAEKMAKNTSANTIRIEKAPSISLPQPEPIIAPEKFDPSKLRAGPIDITTP